MGVGEGVDLPLIVGTAHRVSRWQLAQQGGDERRLDRLQGTAQQGWQVVAEARACMLDQGRTGWAERLQNHRRVGAAGGVAPAAQMQRREPAAAPKGEQLGVGTEARAQQIEPLAMRARRQFRDQAPSQPASPRRRMHGEAHDAGIAKVGRLHQTGMRRQRLRQQVSARAALAGEDRLPQLRRQPAFAGDQGGRQHLFAGADLGASVAAALRIAGAVIPCMIVATATEIATAAGTAIAVSAGVGFCADTEGRDLKVGTIEQMAQIIGAGLVMAEHQQTEHLAEQRVIAGQRLGRVDGEARRCKIGGGDSGIRGRLGIEQQDLVDEWLKRIVLAPAHRGLEPQRPPARRALIEQGAKAQVETAPGALVAMHRGREADAWIPHQQLFQQGRWNPGGLVDQQQIRRRAGREQCIRCRKMQ